MVIKRLRLNAKSLKLIIAIDLICKEAVQKTILKFFYTLKGSFFSRRL